MKATQLSIFETRVYDYQELSIHQKINWKSWNALPVFQYTVFFTIENAPHRIKDWSPKPLLSDRSITEPSPYTKSIFGY